jgi:Uncharacterized protein conserved in bacteria
LKFFSGEKTREYYRASKPFLKRDIAVAVVLLALVTAAVIFSLTAAKGSYADIYVSGEFYATYSLDKDKEIFIKQDGIDMKISIKDGKIFAEESNCPDKLCVKQGGINKANERIICAPNKVIIVVRGKNKEFDAVTGA